MRLTSQLRRLALRQLRTHPWQLGLTILGIALGVAVAVSIDLANASALRAFGLSTEAVSGRATHQILGGPSGVPDALYRRVRLDLGVRRAAPIVEGDVAIAGGRGRTLHLLGIDPFVDGDFRPYLGGEERRGARGRDALSRAEDLVGRRGTALLAASTAAELGLAVGGELAIEASGHRRTLTVVGLLQPADRPSARALESMLVTDIATAQETLGAVGRLTRIDLIVDDPAVLPRITAALPAGSDLVAAGSQAGATARMILAFQWNLAALSLLALVVGMFLIYQTMTFSIVQRRPLIGSLRALGVTRGEIFAVVMSEALVIGLVGTLAGLALGFGMAQGLLRLVTRTINDLYFVLSVREVVLDPVTLGKSVLLGLGATALAALPPALEATTAPPRVVMTRAALETRARRGARRAGWLGLAVIAAGAGVLALPGGIVIGFAGLFVVMVGCALVTPAAALVLLRPVHRLAAGAFGLLGRLATRSIVAALSRTSVAMAALMIAVAAAIGVGVMIASFREAVTRWLEGTLRADVYISAPSLVGSRPDATLDPALVAHLAATPGVARAGTSRGVVVQSVRGPVQVVALDVDPTRPPGWRFRSGGDDGVWNGDAVIVSEPYANRHDARVGGAVRLRTDRGQQDFRVAGVFYDYGSSAGVVVMSRRTYDAAWEDRRISSLALEAAPGVDVNALVAVVRERAAGGPSLVIRSNRALRETSLEIFDRTFAITGVLRTLSVMVAFVGMLAALMALQLERTREIGVLRALGLTPRQVWGLVTAQTGIIGLLAGVLAVPSGLILAAVLVFVINRRSFGWTMSIDPSPAILLQGVALSVLAALLAGLYPAWRMATASPAESLRDE
ncbi:MAG TPA: FtsX-like permease family protein [Methylomirabilota bacterium]|nr:FtsX-like permease family protein [Methylomirabilota bacterium]